MTRSLVIGLAMLVVLAMVLVIILRKRMSSNAQWTWPVNGRISSRFGPRVAPISNASTDHNGVDIAVPIGTPVKAPADGKVISVYTHERGGKSLIVQHADGWKTGYAHLNDWSVKVGDQVKQGDVIAHSGNTGNSGGPHLHFTMTNGVGQKVDPEQYLIA